MDYSPALAPEATQHDVDAIFAETFDEDKFTKALRHSVSQLWTDSGKTGAAIGRVFTTGVSQFVRYAGISEREDASDGERASATLSSRETPNLSTDEKAFPEKAPDSSFGETKNGDVQHDDNGEDITELTKTHGRSASTAELVEPVSLSDGDITDSRNVSKRGSVGESDITHVVNDNHPVRDDDLSDIEVNAAICRIADILTSWVSTISKTAKRHGKDAFSLIFRPPGSEKVPHDARMHELLAHMEAFFEKAIELDNLERVTSLRKLIILMHEMLHAFFVALSLEAGMSRYDDILVVKSLLFCFFQADFAATLQALLDRTTAGTFPVTKPEENDEDSAVTVGKREKKHPVLRLSYETVMKLYGIYVSLANCPIDLIRVDKVSLSLDIAAPEDMSANAYVHSLHTIDFSDPKTAQAWNTRLVAHLAAIFNYYYHLSPDILCHSLRHSSFFGWITWNTLSSGRYIYTDATEQAASFADVLWDPIDPFLYGVKFYELTKRLKLCKAAPDSEKAVRSASYLAITFQIYQLLNNESFVKVLLEPSNSEIPLLDIWLCVLSYVHHHQYKSAVNGFGARVSLLIMLKMTTQKGHMIEHLRDRRIDENKWKICHHKHPVVPLDEACGDKKEYLLYMIDVLQMTFRYNLSKKLDLENAKIALTVLYQILLDLEAHPSEGLHTYPWNELYLALTKFLRFIAKCENEEGVKYLIEELFLVFQLFLSPVFDEIVEKNSNFFSLGYHPAKSMNNDLLYIMLQQRDCLELLFDKYIIKKGNFHRVEKAFVNFKTLLSSLSNTQLHPEDVTRIVTELSIFDAESAKQALVKMEKFNYAETFKYLDQYREYEDFPKAQELVAAFIAIFETDWIGESTK